MGLVLTVSNTEVKDCPRWPYTGFARYRKHLCEALGWHEWVAWFDSAILAKNPPPPKPYSDSWMIKAIASFVNHSDCDGYMSGEHLIELRDALEVIMRIEPIASNEYDRESTEKLIGVLNVCIKNKERLIWA